MGPATVSSHPYEVFLYRSTSMVQGPPDSTDSPFPLLLETVMPVHCSCLYVTAEVFGRFGHWGSPKEPKEHSLRFVFCLVLCSNSASPRPHSSSHREGTECNTMCILTRIPDLTQIDCVLQALFSNDPQEWWSWGRGYCSDIVISCECEQRMRMTSWNR